MIRARFIILWLLVAAVTALPPVPASAGGSSVAALVVRVDGESEASVGNRDLLLGRRGWVSVALKDSRSRAAEPTGKGSRVAWYRVTPDRSAVGGFRDVHLGSLDNLWTVRLVDLRRAAAARESPGTYRFRVKVSGGLPDGRRREIAGPGGAQALRISFRRDDSYIGWLETYFQVPYKYGSTQAEVRRYLYADCADFVVAGYQKMGGAVLGDMGTATMLAQWRWFFDVIHSEVRREGRFYVAADTCRPVTIGPGGARPGDILLFNGHTGVLHGDQNRDGRLDVGDRVIHHLYTPPRVDPVPDVWTGPFALIRWRDFRPLQARLKHIGLYNGPGDGIFNAKLEKALRRFQQRTGLKPDGIPGPKTDSLLAARGRIRK